MTTGIDRAPIPRLTGFLLGLILVTGCADTGDKPAPTGGPDASSATSTGAADDSTYEERMAANALRKGRFVMRSDGPKSFDPIRGSTVYENQCASQVYETLLQYKYLKRPFELEPLLLSEMPKASEDGLTWSFKLKKGVHFHDDPCFSGGKGREMVASDVIYSWKRMADQKSDSKVWWIVKDTIAGFDEFHEEQNAAAEFDYAADVEGLKILNDYEFEVTLRKPATRFLWTLAMFQTAVVPREAVEKYGTRFGLHPVGTGPFLMLEDNWQKGVKITFTRNPNYHECFYPTEHMPEDEAAGLTEPAGQRLPLLDEVQLEFLQQDQPMWLKFEKGDLDFVQVPAEFYEQVFNKRTGRLLPEAREKGLSSHAVPLLDFIFRGFNMEDELLGGYTEEKRNLRQAICLAVDWDETNEAFYNGLNIVYDGPIPPGLAGYPENGTHPESFRGPDLTRARELLAKAGYPGGKGLPRIDFHISKAANSKGQSEMLARQLKEIGVEINVLLVDFSTLIQTVDNKNSPFFAFAWGSDYPDAENNLALFYGPNEAPGANHFNYKNPDYDRLYDQISAMPPSPERTKIFEQMVSMLLKDCPYAGSMARTRFYLAQPRLKYFKPVETFENWYKYVSVQ
ncbi:MAG: ABC transporter substrate-binding protein [Planctomycetaceae bacterium]